MIYTLVNSNIFIFPRAIRIFYQVKWYLIKWHSDYLNVSTMEIDFCFSKLYFSSLIQTWVKFMRISKQLLIEINQVNKAILKSALCQEIKKRFVMWDSILKSMHGLDNYSITCKIFLTSNFSRKHKILHFLDNTFIFRSNYLYLCK